MLACNFQLWYVAWPIFVAYIAKQRVHSMSCLSTPPWTQVANRGERPDLANERPSSDGHIDMVLKFSASLLEEMLKRGVQPEKKVLSDDPKAREELVFELGRVRLVLVEAEMWWLRQYIKSRQDEYPSAWELVRSAEPVSSK